MSVFDYLSSTAKTEGSSNFSFSRPNFNPASEIPQPKELALKAVLAIIIGNRSHTFIPLTCHCYLYNTEVLL